MSLTEAALKKMSKDEVLALTLEYQAKFNSTVANIADLKSDFRRLESEISISIGQLTLNFVIEWEVWSVNVGLTKSIFQ